MELEKNYIDFLDKKKITKTIIDENSIIVAEETDFEIILKDNKEILGIESKIQNECIFLKQNKNKFMELVEIIYILLIDGGFTIDKIETIERITIAEFILTIKDDDWIEIKTDNIFYFKHIIFYKTYPDLPDEFYKKEELEKQIAR